MSILSPRVLVLEDHSFQRAVAVRMLKQLGCSTVYEAADGAEALALLKEVGPVDVALCDLQMEGMDGIEFIQRVGGGAQVESIIITSSLSTNLRRAVGQIVSELNLKFLGDLSKPLQLDALQTLLDKHARVRSLRTTTPAPAIALASEQDVRRALAEHELRAWYQPKFNLSTGAVLGVEVLARWEHPVKGILAPALFIPTLERFELMDQWLFVQMNQALTLQENLQQRGILLNMAFNVHAGQLANRKLPKQIKQLLAQHGVAGSEVTFEVTECGLLEMPAVSYECLVRLRMMGCRLSIDDFGTGFSSMQRLCQMPFDEIKLDSEFVRNSGHEPRCLAVINSILSLGKTLDMSVVIEGIETDNQLQQLLDLGCTQGQGYWFARPMSGSDLTIWLSHLSSCKGEPMTTLRCSVK